MNKVFLHDDDDRYIYLLLDIAKAKALYAIKIHKS